jgi:hypothetical protein
LSTLISPESAVSALAEALYLGEICQPVAAGSLDGGVKRSDGGTLRGAAGLWLAFGLCEGRADVATGSGACAAGAERQPFKFYV